MKPTEKKMRKLIGRAVVIEWDESVTDADWPCFRVERAYQDMVCMSGMADEDGNAHDGSWVRVPMYEIKEVWLRW